MIAERFVAQGARVVHLVDFDGARAGAPANLDAIGRVANRIATPIQVAGGLDGADNIRIAFAAGATRAVISMNVVDEPAVIRACLAVAGDWLAVGLDPRPERFAAFPWRRGTVPTLDQLVGELADLGVRRFVLSHSGDRPGRESLEALARLVRQVDADLTVAGGVLDLDDVRRLRDAGLTGLILGEALLSGAIDYPAAQEAAA